MGVKRIFREYYLLLVEGATEFNLFAYLTKKKFKKIFAGSNVQFSNKVEIIKDNEQVVSQGNLQGISDVKSFKIKNTLIKKKYAGQRLFFLLDKDIKDWLEIEEIIKKNGDVVQFIEYNSEYLLLKLGGRKIRGPSDFNNLVDFRNYCKEQFQKQFKKKASEFKDIDFDSIFDNTEDTKIRKSFVELFSII